MKAIELGNNRIVDGGVIVVKRANVGWKERSGKEMGLRTLPGRKLVRTFLLRGIGGCSRRWR